MTLLFTSWILSAYFSFENSYTHKVAEPFESFDFLYDKPWQRIGPYTMGKLNLSFYFHFIDFCCFILKQTQKASLFRIFKIILNIILGNNQTKEENHWKNIMQWKLNRLFIIIYSEKESIDNMNIYLWMVCIGLLQFSIPFTSYLSV